MNSLVRTSMMVVALSAAWIGNAHADLFGASVTGDLRYPVGGGAYNEQNLFDPANFGVPPGYGNSASPTIVLSGTGQGNFAWLQGGGTIEEPGIDSWFAEFAGAQLRVVFRKPNYPGSLSGARLQFRSDAFAGMTIQQVGVDAFLSAGNGPMTATVNGDTITLTVAEQCVAGSGCLWPDASYSNTYALTPVAVVDQLTLRSSVVAGCKSVTGTVTLSAPAPAAGTIVNISDTLTAATTPLTVTVPAGATSKTFSVKTVPVAVTESGTVRATVGGTTLSQNLTVRPMGLGSVTLTPTSTVGGTQVAGKATLECKAGPGAILVGLSSNNAAVATPVAASIAVSQGLQSVSFDVTTRAVQARSYATIAGTANGITKSKKLTVNVAAAVSPTRLGFGSVPVNTTSGLLNATLTNKGATAFSVSSIGLTGTNAKYYAQTNNCPVNLTAGASCTIGVRFKPTVTGSKSATLSIATSATSTPLRVTLSATGL